MCHHSKTRGAYGPGLRVADVAINKQKKDKILAKRRSECVECSKHSKSQDRKETRRKVPGLVEVPACSNQRGRLCETHGEEPECRGPALVDPGNSKGGRRRRGKTCLFINERLD